jgi:hypothetical protein
LGQPSLTDLPGYAYANFYFLLVAFFFVCGALALYGLFGSGSGERNAHDGHAA